MTHADLLAKVRAALLHADEYLFDGRGCADPYNVLAKAAIDAVVQFITEPA